MTLSEIIFGELPLYPYWLGLFIFFAMGATLYQYKFKIQRGLKKTGEPFNPWKYLKNWENHFDFAMMVIAGFAILRFANYALGTDATIENMEMLCACSFVLGTVGQKTIDKAFQLGEKLLGKNNKTD